MTSRKPETTFIQKINRRIPQVYAEKNNNPYRSGTPDVWYSGMNGDLWVEYKCLPTTPVKRDVLPDLSPAQRYWLSNRYVEGRNVAVVVGCPAGAYLYTAGSWDEPLPAQEFIAGLKTAAEISQWILSQVGASYKCQLKM